MPQTMKTSVHRSNAYNDRIMRWGIMLDEYGCNVDYAKAKDNVLADLLSRLDPEEVRDA